MELYHGSENIIEKPQFGWGKSTNDFGRGFFRIECWGRFLGFGAVEVARMYNPYHEADISKLCGALRRIL